MKFCEKCDNMLYLKLSEDRDLVYYCKNCGHSIPMKKEDGSICVIDDNTVDDNVKFSQYINKYIKFDPTLPRVNNITCVNPQCTKKKDEENEIIYLKYDADNMKYLYYCTYCDNFWR